MGVFNPSGGAGAVLDSYNTYQEDYMSGNVAAGAIGNSNHYVIGGTSFRMWSENSMKPGILAMTSTAVQSAQQWLLFPGNGTLLQGMYLNDIEEWLIVFRPDVSALPANNGAAYLQIVNGTGVFNRWVGFYFDSAVSANWRILAVNGGAATVQDTGVAVDVNWHKFLIRPDFVAGTVEFFIDGTSVGSLNSNIPWGIDLSPKVQHYRNVAGLVQEVFIDYQRIKFLNLSRA